MIAAPQVGARLRSAFDRTTWRRIVDTAGAVRGPLRALAVGIFFTACLRLVEPLLFRAIVNGLVDVRLGRGHPNFLLLAGLVLAVEASIAIGTFASSAYGAKVHEGVLFHLEKSLFDKFQRMPYAFFGRTQHGAIVSRLTNDLDDAQELYTAAFPTSLSNLITFVAGLTILFLQEWRLAIALAAMTLLVLPVRWISTRVQRLAREQFAAQAEYMALIGERLGVSGALLTKLYGNYDSALHQFDEKANRAHDRVIAVAMGIAAATALIGVGTAIAVAVVVYVGSQLASNGSVSLGTLVLFLFYVRIIAQPIGAYGQMRFQIAKAVVSFQRVYEVLEHPGGDATAATPVELVSSDAVSVVFDDVSFRYPTGSEATLPSLDLVPETHLVNDEVVQHVSFTIPSGRTTAIVGPSGAGKSTISMLVAGLYRPSGGSIHIGGVDTSGLDPTVIGTYVALVTQDAYLFHGTIRENLRYARPHAPEEDVIASCKAAGIHGFVKSLPAGYNTVVGERGVRLSGGQKQRIALARALLKGSPVVVLDEATAHLDSESERAVNEAFRNAFSSKTKLVIAHRLSTVVDADEILVFSDGEVVESGTHVQLLAMGGLYEQLYSTQHRATTVGPLATEAEPDSAMT